MRRLFSMVLLISVSVLAGCASNEDRFVHRIAPNVPEAYTELSLGVLRGVAEKFGEDAVFKSPFYNVHFLEHSDTLVFVFEWQGSFSRERSIDYIIRSIREAYWPSVQGIVGAEGDKEQTRLPTEIGLEIYFSTHIIGPVTDKRRECAFDRDFRWKCDDVYVTVSGPVDPWRHVYLSRYKTMDLLNAGFAMYETIRDL